MTELTEEMKAKISEGMKRAHARRRKAKLIQKKTPGATHNGGLLGRLRAMRDLLDQAIKDLERVMI